MTVGIVFIVAVLVLAVGCLLAWTTLAFHMYWHNKRGDW